MAPKEKKTKITPEKHQIKKALDKAFQFGSTDGEHHKMWVIDQMVRALTGCPMVTKKSLDCNGIEYTYSAQGESEEYREWVTKFSDGEDGPNTYEWDEGRAP